MKKHLILFMIMQLCILVVFAQQKQLKPSKIIKAVKFDKSPQLRDIKIIEPQARIKKHGKNDFNKFQKYPFPCKKMGSLPLGKDPVLQDEFGTGFSCSPIMNFPGMDNVNNSGVPDTEGDVGPNHYFQMINFSFAIWDKSGNLMYGPADNITLWDGFPGPWSNTNSGDPIVIYDPLADRWLASQMAVCDGGLFYELIAVSETG
ncbi:MAG: hypothetical protein K8R58_01970, partial [Bacteroidales bacterium]|nr:hypothetical protein [Bacteroidales bacterium]